MPEGINGRGSYFNPKRNLSYRGAGRKTIGRDLGTPTSAHSGKSTKRSKVPLQVVKDW